MVIIGLGTNVGDRLKNLRLAHALISQISGFHLKRVSPLYHSDAMLPDNAPASWNQYFLNCALAGECTLAPENLLTALQEIEKKIGRDTNHAHWSPREIDIDILAWGDLHIQTDTLTIPKAKLPERPFALWPLADLTPLWMHPLLKQTAEQLVKPWGSRYTGQAAFHTRQINLRIDTPALVGIINVTPDSFSDGGNFYSAEQAFHQAKLLIEAGAEILDIGAEATSPQVKPIDPETEWQRLEPVLQAVTQAKTSFLISPLISIDTRHPYVAERALSFNIDWLNDVTGFQDPAMRAIAKESNVDCVVMHHLSLPPTQEKVLPLNLDPVTCLLQWGRQQIELLEKDGIARERIIIDPGIGFGKTPGQSLALLQQAHRLHELKVRVLIGHSRKLFMGSLTPYTSADRDLETTIIADQLIRQNVDYLRVHNVEYCARSFRVQALFA